jgi:hypothetical protein
MTSASKVPAAFTTISRGGSYADRNNQEPRFSPAVGRRHRRAIRVTLSRHGRFRIRPDVGTEYLSNEAAAAKSTEFLFDEMGSRLAKEPVKVGVFVQMVEPSDDVADASVTWPDSRMEIPFGTITLAAPRRRSGARPPQNHLRPPAQGGWHRFVGRSAHGNARRHLPVQRPSPAGCLK